MYSSMAWLTEADKPAARGWAELEIIGAACFSDLIGRGIAGEDGTPRKMLSDWRLLKATQLAYEAALGMLPSARASMGLDVAKGQFFKEKLAEHGNSH